MNTANLVTTFWQYGLDHLETIIVERIGLIAVPIIFTIGFAVMGLMFLSSRANDRRYHVEFSRKGIGSAVDSEDAVNLTKKPSALVALILVFFIGSFGVFYLAPVAGMALSLMVLVSSLIIFESFRWFLVVQFVLWAFSLVTTIILLNIKSTGSWYEIH